MYCYSLMSNFFRLIRCVAAQRVPHSTPYVIMHLFREKALTSTSLVTARFSILRLILLKIGAEVRELKTKLHCILPASCPMKEIFAWMRSNIAG